MPFFCVQCRSLFCSYHVSLSLALSLPVTCDAHVLLLRLLLLFFCLHISIAVALCACVFVYAFTAPKCAIICNMNINILIFQSNQRIFSVVFIRVVFFYSVHSLLPHWLGTWRVWAHRIAVVYHTISVRIDERGVFSCVCYTFVSLFFTAIAYTTISLLCARAHACATN